jgi:hypothetical protein
LVERERERERDFQIYFVVVYSIYIERESVSASDWGIVSKSTTFDVILRRSSIEYS